MTVAANRGLSSSCKPLFQSFSFSMQDQLKSIIEAALRPQQFFVARPNGLRIQHVAAERVPWEIFRGHLLDGSQTPLQREFESWNVFVENPGVPERVPLLSVKLDHLTSRLYVTRNILIYGWEAYEPSAGVISSRPTRKWMPELVGTIALARAARREDAAQPLSRCLLLAVVGTSRLPITSLESPLPAFSLGKLAYGTSAISAAGASSNTDELIASVLDNCRPRAERAKLLEAALRTSAADEIADLTRTLFNCLHDKGINVGELPAIVKSMFNHVAQAPYTSFASHLVSMLAELATPKYLGAEPVIDLLGFMLRHLVRHLTAYDLVTFHNSGANYPDALVLDELLRAYVALLDQHVDALLNQDQDDERMHRLKRQRRRALRQAWLVRKQCEGYLVPDAPTSPGENLRVLPDPFSRVPDEQFLHRAKRRKRLFADQPVEELLSENAARVLDQSIDDLSCETELRELGTALFLDRPLGIGKQPGEVDRTLLLSYEAQSCQIAQRRLEQLCDWGLLPAATLVKLTQPLRERPTEGFPVNRLPCFERPGVVALEDARKAADDFVFVRTSRQSLQELLAQYDFELLRKLSPRLYDWLAAARHVLLVRTASVPRDREPLLVAYDQRGRPQIELAVGQSAAQTAEYVESAGVEYLAGGLQVLRIWDDDATDTVNPQRLLGDDVRFMPRLE